MKRQSFVAVLACMAVSGSALAFNGSYIGVSVGMETLDTKTKPHTESGIGIPVEPDNGDNLPVEPDPDVTIPIEHKGTISLLSSSVTNQASLNSKSAGLDLVAGFGQVFGGQWYAGSEIAIGFSGLNEKSSKQIADNATAKTTVKSNYHYGITTRLGYVVDESTLVFIKGGLDRRHFKTTSDIAGYGKRSQSNTLSGWLVGAGVEHKVNDNTSLRLDYGYSQYEKGKLFSTNPSSHRVMAGLNYYF